MVELVATASGTNSFYLATGRGALLRASRNNDLYAVVVENSTGAVGPVLL